MQLSTHDRLPALLDWMGQMRETQPVYYDEKTRFWNVFLYDDIQHALSDPATFSSDTSIVLPQAKEAGIQSKGDLTNMDPPRHRKLRNLVSQAFTPRVVEQMAPRIAEITNQFLDERAAKGEMDLIRDLAAPLPITVIAELLGVPAEDRDRFREWSDTLMGSADPDSLDMMNDALIQAVAPTMQEMYDYLRVYCQDRRRHPREDMISRLTTAEVDGQQLDDDEILGFVSLLLLAGNVTTTILLGNAIYCLDGHPDAMKTLLADMSLLPSTIEEVLRYRAPFTMTVRVTKTPVTIRNVTIPERQLVNVWLISANYDKNHFSDPQHFDIRRTPNRHMTFGHGIHFCIGAPLARLEGRIALNILLQRFPPLHIKSDAEIQMHGNSMVTGLKNLPVTW
jgi:cytochrome P450